MHINHKSEHPAMTIDLQRNSTVKVFSSCIKYTIYKGKIIRGTEVI